MQTDKQTHPDDPHRNPGCRGCGVCNHDGPGIPPPWLQIPARRDSHGTRRGPESATEQVVRLLRARADGRSIREQLRIPPSRLRRILNSPTLQKALEQDRQVAHIERIVGSRGGDGGVLKARLSGSAEGITPAHSGTQRDSAG